MSHVLRVQVVRGLPAMLPATSNRTIVHRLLVTGLAVLLFSCGSARHMATPRAEELTGFVLVIEEASDGQVSHSWQRASDVDLSRYARFVSACETGGSIVLAASRPRNCDQEQIDCYQECMRSRLPSKLSHIRREDGGKSRHCSKECLTKYLDCLELQKANALEFSATNDAVEWLKRNRKEVLVGSIVIITGVAFVTLSAGAGLIILAPVVLVAG